MKQPIQYGMPTLIENRTLGENIALCRRLGLRFIELNMNFPEYQLDPLEQTDRLLDAADAAGIYYTIHLDENLNVADFNPLVTGAYTSPCRTGRCRCTSGISAVTWLIAGASAASAGNGLAARRC